MSGVDCSRCDSPLEAGDLRCAVCGDVPEQLVPQVTSEGLEQTVLRCGQCGAATRYDARSESVRCSFCSGELKPEELTDPVEQTEAYLPFTVDRDGARAALRSWLGNLGFFRPSDLKSAARIEDLRPLWWAGWVFDAHARVSWTADSNAGAGRSNWAPHSGQTDLVFDDVLISASRGLSDKEAYTLSSSYSLTTATPELEAPPDDATLEAFDVQRSQARARITDGIRRAAASRLQEGHIPGSRFRNIHVRALLTGLDTRRMAFPAWVMAYRYEHKLFRVVISGQDAQVLMGKAPISWAKIMMIVAGVIVVGLVLGLVAVLFS
ncbi:MAG: hypothetical protein CMJ98_01335 [Planctomycetes bacterium]|nr:hypothetical protein [Planctomycetota bacterium]HJM58725.1 hypothetical protein [Planctomycetota bacterium]